MAHRRAVSRPRAWAPWVLVPVALALDGAAALGLTGQRFPMGLIVPEGVLLAAPLLVYGALAFLAFRTRSLGMRLAAAAVLLGIHAGLVALHTVCYIGLWSLPAPAALRLAHRWSPLIPLLQLVWVPLLALPLATLVRPPPPRSRPRPAPPRRAPGRVSVETLVSRASQAGPRKRTEPERYVPVVPAAPEPAPIAPAEAVAAVEPEPVPIAPAPSVLPPVVAAMVSEASAVAPLAPVADGGSSTTAPAPTWFDDLVEASSHAVIPPLSDAETVGEAAPAMDQAELPEVGETDTVGDDQPAIAVAAIPEAIPVVVVEPLAALPAWSGDTSGEELPRAAEVAPVMAAAVPDIPTTEAVPVAAAPPVDLDRVARVFAPYGPLLSRDRAVVVDWTPGPDAAVVCVAPREMSRDHVVRLAVRLARGLDGAGAPSAPGPVRRLSLRGPEGVVVLTPLDGAVLVVAARRPGALALLEVLSARVVPSATDVDAGARAPDTSPAVVATGVSGAIRVETPAAMLDVLAPAGVAAPSMGELAGRLLAAIAADGGGPALHTLSVDLGAHRLMVHPVHPDARPPRFVAVVGGPERPGLLGRRAERAARTLREAS